MTPAERVAIERYRNLCAACQFDETALPYKGVLSDAFAVAAIALKDHPADDETAIDEAWLRSISFVYGSGLGHLPLAGEFCLQAYETQHWHIETNDTTGGYYGCYHSLDLPCPTTRGEVRRLLAALGIAIKEAK